MAAGCVSRWLAEAATAAGSCRAGGGEPRRLALVLALARWRSVAPVASRAALAPRMGNRSGKRPGSPGNDKRRPGRGRPSVLGLGRARVSCPESRRNAAGGAASAPPPFPRRRLDPLLLFAQESDRFLSSGRPRFTPAPRAAAKRIITRSWECLAAPARRRSRRPITRQGRFSEGMQGLGCLTIRGQIALASRALS